MTIPGLLIGRAAVSFLASFLAIWVWSRTREESWLFIITGILLSFVLLVMEVLSLTGLLPVRLTGQDGVPLWFGILQLVPYILYALGLGFYLFRNRRY